MNNNVFKLLPLAAVCVVSTQVSAQYRIIEDIVVSARKRVENLQDVPISISTLQGEEMRNWGVINLESVAPSIPNFTHAEATISSDQFIIRGVGTTGANVGFEQAVGQVVNGFFYGRSRWGRSAFLDIDRLEVLKGPQGALIGKNTSAGAINITTNKPTEVVEGYVFGNYDFDASEGASVEGAISGPLTDTVRARLAFRTDQRDGWVENVNTGEDEGVRDDNTLRLIVDWDLTDSLTGEFLYQYNDFSKTGRNREYSVCNDGTRAAIEENNFPEDCEFNSERDTIFLFNGQETDETHETEADVFGATFEWSFDSAVLTSLTNYSTYEVADRWDIDQQPLERINAEWFEEYEQFSQEIRLTSSGFGTRTLDYIVGLYYQTNDIDFEHPFHFVQFGPNSATRQNQANQQTDTLAVFAQLDWHINEALTLTVGGRFTDEEKDAEATTYASELYTDIVIPGGVGGGPVGSLGAGNDLKDSRSESDFSPNVSLQYSLSDDHMLYFSFAEGFKGGGFDMMNTSPQELALQTWEFEEETSRNFEVGGKHEFFDNSLRANWALFRTEFDDLQVTALDGLTIQQVTTNAASVISQGLELDVDWRPTNSLLLGISYAYLNAEYDKFDTAPCFAAQSAEEGCITLDGGGQVQDLSGEQVSYAPENQLTFDMSYEWRLSDEYDVNAGLEWIYVDDQFLQVDHDPLDFQEAYDKINARLQLSSTRAGWSLALVGRNLTDELTSNFSNDTGGLGGGAGNHFKFSEEPRALALQGRWEF